MSAIALSSRAIIGEFFLRLEQKVGMDWIDLISMHFNSDQESETYKWLGMVPGMREWIGGRNAKGFRDNGITIENKEYEATLEVLVKELRRDKTDQVMLRIRELADRTNAHWADLLSTLIINGESTVGYDGQFFFDTDHAEGDNSTNQSNDISVTLAGLPATNHGSTTAPSVEEMQATILKAIQAILGFKDDQNKPMNENASRFLVMTPTPLWNVAVAAVNNPVLAAGESNVIQNLPGMNISVANNARLTWTDKVSVWRTDGNAKPLIRQEEVPVKVSAIAEGSELEFTENKHHYGVYASRNVGYGFWQHACLAKMI